MSLVIWKIFVSYDIIVHSYYIPINITIYNFYIGDFNEIWYFFNNYKLLNLTMEDNLFDNFECNMVIYHIHITVIISYNVYL